MDEKDNDKMIGEAINDLSLLDEQTKPPSVFWDNFLINHGERLIYMAIATLLATFLYYCLDMKEEASVIFIAVMTLALNKARGTLLAGKPGSSP